MSDLIRREDVLETMSKDQWYFIKPREQIERIKAIPTAKPKVGRWIFDEKGYFFCSECKRKPNSQYATTDYCPNCGAKMKGE